MYVLIGVQIAESCTVHSFLLLVFEQSTYYENATQWGKNTYKQENATSLCT